MPRRVAVKVLHPQHAENPTVRARFKRELEAACRVSHENVVSVYDIGEDPNLGLYYVMELVRGTPLKDYLTGDPLPWPFVYRVGLQLTRAIHAIHSAGIIHRDLKPQNIMLVERSSLDELVKVLDFGIASLKTQDEDKEHNVELTGARMVLGTPPYMSPEQTYMKSDRDRLNLAVDARSDLYSLGVILYELAAGRRPFSGDAHEIVVAHRLTKPMPLHRMVGVSVPRPFADLVMQCLSKDPKDRPESAKTLAHDLKLCEDLPVRRWRPEDEEPADPRDLATQMDADPLPLSHTPPPPRTTQPHLNLTPTLSRPSRALWAPLATLAAAALLVAWFMLPRDLLNTHPDAVVAEVQPVAPPPPAATPPHPPEATAAVTHAKLNAPPSRPTEAAAPAAREPETPPPTRPSPTTPVAQPSPEARSAPQPPTQLEPSGALTAVAAIKPTVNLMVTTTPAGATVLIAGEASGLTPLNVAIDASEDKQIELVIEKKRYRSYTMTMAIGPALAGKVILVNEDLKKIKRAGAGAKPGKAKDPFKDL